MNCPVAKSGLKTRFLSWTFRISEKIVLTIFVLAAALWCFGPMIRAIEINGSMPFKALSDTVIAMGAGIILFIIPVDQKRGVHALDWSSASEAVAWDVLLLFGGGLTMASAIQVTGLANAVGAQAVAFGSLPEIAIMGGVTSLAVFASEFTSRYSISRNYDAVGCCNFRSINRSRSFCRVCTTLGASMAFMMPVGTPPNAIIFGTGRIRIADGKIGFWLNVISIIVITLLCSIISVGVIA